MSEKSFVLRRLILHSPNFLNGIDLSGLYFNMTIKTDIRFPFITGTVGIYDAAGYNELFPILGEERLEVELETKSQITGKIDVIKKMFRIYEMTPQARNNITVGSAYNLHFISYEFFINQRTKIFDSFLNREDGSGDFRLPLSSISEIIYTKHIKNKMIELFPGFEKDILVERTLRNYNIMFPNMNPFRAILLCANRALSFDRLNNKGATYLFYEDFDNFHFKSLESMFTEDIIGEYNYLPSNVSDFSQDPKFMIENFQVNSSFNVRDNLTAGMYSSKLITYDFELMKIKEYDFEYVPQSDFVSEQVIQDGQRVNVLKRNVRDPESDLILDKSKAIQPLGKLCTGSNDNLNNPNSVVHLVSSNANHDILFDKNEQQQGGYKEKGIEPKQIEEYFLQRRSQLQQLENIKVSVTLKESNVDIRLGNMLIFNLPSETYQQQNEKTPPSSHFYYGGKYIVTKVQYDLRKQSDQLVTTLQLSKNSIDHPMPDFDPSVLDNKDVFNTGIDTPENFVASQGQYGQGQYE